MVDKILASRGRKRFRKKRTRKKVGGKPYGYKNCPDNAAVLENSNDRMYPVPTSGKKKLMDCDPTDRQCGNVRRGAQGVKWGEGSWGGVANCDGGQAWYDHNYNIYKKNPKKKKKYALRLKKFYEAMKDEEWFTKYDSWWRSTLADGHQKKRKEIDKNKSIDIGTFGRKVTKDVPDGFNPATNEDKYKWNYENTLQKYYTIPSSVKATYTVKKDKEVKANYLDDYVEMMREQKFTVTVNVPELEQSGAQSGAQSGGESSLFAALKAAKNKIKNKIKEKKNVLMAKTTTTAAEASNVDIPIKPKPMVLKNKTIAEYYEEILKEVKPFFPLPRGIVDEPRDIWEEKRIEMRTKKADLLKKMGEIFRDKFEIIVEEEANGGGKVRKSKKRKSRRKKRKETRRKSRRRRRR